jgi:ATP-dependent RNA helicase HelY
MTSRYPFDIDSFQQAAFDALDAGRHVVVAAPTGSGKTVVAEYGIEAPLHWSCRGRFWKTLSRVSPRT